jgi:3-deoxy-7-phosphoheptulonate synthase
VPDEMKTSPAVSAARWTPESWQSRPVLQHPRYPDDERLRASLEELRTLPPLVTSLEIDNLRQQLASAVEGEAFLLQGGDCSERLLDCGSSSIAAKVKVLLQMSLVLMMAGKKRLIRVGRFAGQYAKPRSGDTESRGGVTLPVYRGDMINRAEFSLEARTPDPVLLIRAYERAALTLNFIRSLTQSGFADIHHPEYWRLDVETTDERAAEYASLLREFGDDLRFMESITGSPAPKKVDLFISHEALNLHYEQAHTSRVPRRPGWYDLSTHFPWIGDRTRGLDGAHVEYASGIVNPIAVKIGPSATPDEVLALIDTLDPKNEPGRLTLITRFGATKAARDLPPIVQAVVREGRRVLWCCDPMHGNTEMTKNLIKTRHFDNIMSELEQTHGILQECGTRLGGVHIEISGDDVTECLGGPANVTEEDLPRNYRSNVDPRLNYLQAMELAIRLSRLLVSDKHDAARRHPDQTCSER